MVNDTPWLTSDNNNINHMINNNLIATSNISNLRPLATNNTNFYPITTFATDNNNLFSMAMSETVLNNPTIRK